MTDLFRTRIEYLSAARVADDSGGAHFVWTVFARSWARIDRLAPARDVAGDRGRFLARVSALVRWRADLEPGQRFAADGRVFDLVSVESVDERERRLLLIGEEAQS